MSTEQVGTNVLD